MLRGDITHNSNGHLISTYFIIAVILSLSIAFGIVFIACSKYENDQTKTTFISIGTAGITGVYYPIGGAIARIVNKKRKHYGIRCTVESTGGSVFNINAVMAGDLESQILNFES